MQTSAGNLVQSLEPAELSFEECIHSDIPDRALQTGRTNSLEEWERNLEEMLWIIQKNPERRSLAPEAPKSKEWVKIRKEPVQKNSIV